MHQHLEVTYLPPGDLEPAPYNPRVMPEDQMAALKAGIQTFGFVDPVIVNRTTGYIVGGHQRVAAAKALGLAEVPVVHIEADEAREKELNVALNRISGAWDDEMLKLLLEGMDEEGRARTGFTDDELAAILEGGSVEVLPPGDEPDESAGIGETVEPIAKPGDLFALGAHRLLCGDATNPLDLDRLMAGKKADVVNTDPPYGKGYVSNRWDGDNAKTRARKSNEPIDGDDDTTAGTDALALLPAYLADAVHLYVWCNWECIGAFRVQVETYATVKGVITWDKETPGTGDLECSYWDSEQAIHAIVGRRPLAERQNSVWRAMRIRGNDLDRFHPTQKPVELAERAINNSCAPGAIVLDPFSGSGWTLMACEATGREARAIEKAPNYVDKTIERWCKHTGREAYLLTPEGGRKSWSELKRESGR